MRRPALLPLLLGLSLALGAGSVAAEPKASTPSATGTPLSLSGRWVMVQVTTTKSDLPFVGAARASTRAVLLYDLTHDGTRVRGPGELCSLDIEAYPDLLRPVIPKRFARAVRPSPVDATLTVVDGRPHLESARALVVVGAALKEPWSEALPDEDDDPRIRDTDGDGHPGVTIELVGLVEAEVYMAQRRWDRLQGDVRGADRVEGTVVHANEQSFLGSDLPLVNMIPQMDPDLERSRFLMQRVDTTATCSDALGLARDKLAGLSQP